MTSPLKRALPLLHGGRDAMTCLYRCGNACAHPVPNTSDNTYFGDVAAAALSRRGLFRAGAIGAVAVGVAAAADAPAAATPPVLTHKGSGGGGGRPDAGGLTFHAVPPNTLDAVVVPNGYDHAVVVRWGDPVLPGAPRFDIDDQSAAAQAQQFGYNCDFVAFVPLARDRALLWVNHEYTAEVLMFAGYTDGASATPEQMRIAMNAHGGSIVEVERVARTGQWRLSGGQRRFNRRFTASTPMRFTGPAAGSPLLRTAADPQGRTVLGSLNNCAGGLTPWGTILTAEENFNQYFVGGPGVAAPDRPALARYGISTTTAIPGDSRRWDRVEPRFDLARHPNEANRFGYVVEIDPFDPRSTPRKHTALGRTKHEAANVSVGPRGEVAVYLGDDERFDYIYKFVASRPMRRGNDRHSREQNMRLLEDGTLYVARFTGDSPASEIDGSGRLPSDGAFDGTGTWIPLAAGGRSMVPGMSVDQVLVLTRLAGDRVGATKMDRPEDVEVHPDNGEVYVALTNNSNRGASGQPGPDEANPRATNRHGHIVRIVEDGGPAGTTFRWDVPIVCGDPADASTYFAGFDKTKVSPISAPDNLAFDGSGNLWIATDGNALGSHDGLFAVPLTGPDRGHLKQFLTMPNGAECCGPLITPDQRTVCVAVQHPGEITGATVENPASSWPDGAGPRPSVVSVWRVAEGSDRIGA